jgi:predicted transcriptional regulator
MRPSRQVRPNPASRRRRILAPRPRHRRNGHREQSRRDRRLQDSGSMASSPPTQRVVRILNLLARDPDQKLTVTAIARRLDLNLATCQAILATLADAGFIVRSSVDRTYTIGPALARLGDAARTLNPALAAVGEALEVLFRETVSRAQRPSCATDTLLLLAGSARSRRSRCPLWPMVRGRCRLPSGSPRWRGDRTKKCGSGWRTPPVLTMRCTARGYRACWRASARRGSVCGSPVRRPRCSFHSFKTSSIRRGGT